MRCEFSSSAASPSGETVAKPAVQKEKLVIRWSQSRLLWISSVTLMELIYGAEKLSLPELPVRSCSARKAKEGLTRCCL